MTPPLTQWAVAAHLVRRAGFGATGPQVDAAMHLGTSAYVSGALRADPQADPGAKATPPPTFAAVAPLGKGADIAAKREHNRQLRIQLGQLSIWWLRRMVAVEQPMAEKLTFIWHNHFATSATKVRHAPWMLAQNQTLRTEGRGDFRTLALAMLTDAAMLDWLDGQKNTAAAPNENLSREFMELFALGHGDGYTETDVRQGARALTGWKITPNGTTHLSRRQHDNGSKTFLGVTGNLDVTGYCDAILARPAAAPFLVSRCWGQLASNNPPSPATEGMLTAAYGKTRDLSALFTAMLTSPDFAQAHGSLIIGPVEWLIGAMRALKIASSDTATFARAAAALRGLGQLPFYPPNVSGWPSGQAWLSTAAADARLQIALLLAKAGDLSSITAAPPTGRLEAVGYLLGIQTWSDRTRAVLSTESTDPQRLVAIALNSAEYLVH